MDKQGTVRSVKVLKDPSFQGFLGSAIYYAMWKHFFSFFFCRY